MSDHNKVLVEVQDHIAWVYLNRPEKLNGLDLDMFHGLVAAAKKIRKDRSVRAVILAAKGESFSAGLDFKAVSKNPSMIPKLFLKFPWTKMNLAQRIAHIWRDLPVPVICAIHGNCFGGGMQIALAADYRIATPDANLCIMEMKWGLVPDMGGYALWRGLVRDDVLRELTYTNRIFNGTEAQEMGFATHVSDNPLDDAMALAKQIALKNPDAIKASKRIFNSMQDATDAELLMAESVEQDKIIRTPNQMEAVFAEMQKRKPAFTD